MSLWFFKFYSNCIFSLQILLIVKSKLLISSLSPSPSPSALSTTIDGSSIDLIAQTKNIGASSKNKIKLCMFIYKTYYSFLYSILSFSISVILPLQYIQNPTNSYDLHHHHPSTSHHLSSGPLQKSHNWSSCFHPSPLHSFLTRSGYVTPQLITL